MGYFGQFSANPTEISNDPLAGFVLYAHLLEIAALLTAC
jgi:hypothetical protein